MSSNINAQENTSLIKKKRGSGASSLDPVDLQEASMLVKGAGHDVYEDNKADDESLEVSPRKSKLGQNKVNISSGDLKLPSIYANDN